MPSRRLDPDTALEISLNGTASRLVGDGLPASEIVAALRDAAMGRADLLARAAGSKLGGFMGSPAMTNPNDLLAAAYLVLAGADPDLTRDVTDEVRRNVSASGYRL